MQATLARIAALHLAAEPAVSEAENPDRMAPDRQPTMEDLRGLSGPATPAFALQLRGRVRRLIAPLPAEHPVRAEGERIMESLRALAFESGEPRGLIGPGEQPWRKRG